MGEIAPGLWRSTAPHPAWRPGAERDSPDDWDESVDSVLYIGRDTAVFIDPLVPRDEGQFWSWADERVSERNVAVLTTLLPHRRSREQVAHRYGASTSRVRRNLPDGVSESWLYWVRVNRDQLRTLLEPLLDLPIERVLVSHGDRCSAAQKHCAGACRPEDRILGAAYRSLRQRRSIQR